MLDFYHHEHCCPLFLPAGVTAPEELLQLLLNAAALVKTPTRNNDYVSVQASYLLQNHL